MKSKKERVTFAVDMILEYQNDDGRRHLINSVLRDMRMDLGGVGDVIGHYSVKHVEGSARLWNVCLDIPTYLEYDFGIPE